MAFNADAILQTIVADETARIRKDLQLYERYFYSGKSQRDFAKDNGIHKYALSDIKTRYNLPSPSPTAKQTAKAKRKLDENTQLCRHRDCLFCAFLARAWRVEREVD